MPRRNLVPAVRQLLHGTRVWWWPRNVNFARKILQARDLKDLSNAAEV